MMANAVYERTRAGLSGLVPGRAARRILDSALGDRQRTADAVSADEMAGLLLGPVYRDLSGVLPRRGLRREMEHLVRSIRELDPPPAAAPEARTAVTATVEAAPQEGRLEGDLIATTDVATPPPQGRAAATPVARAGERSLPSDPELVLQALAVLDGVSAVCSFDAAGRVASARGDLDDAEALGRVVAASGDLLARHGALRTVSVTTSHGVLFAVPVPPQWLAVIGEPGLNLGAVYAALAALEEER